MTISLAIPTILAIAMLAVIVLDISRYIIPNALNLAILLLYVVAAYMLGLPWGFSLIAAGIALFAGLAMFSLGLMGGGDVKLLVVLMLWTGWTAATPQFIVLTAVLGGLLVVVVLILRMIAPPFFKARLPRVLTRKEPVPYGVAIAGAFLYMLMTGGVPGLARPF